MESQRSFFSYTSQSKKRLAFSFATALILFFILLTTPVALAAGTPAIMSYQGRLADANGDLLGGSGTTYYFKFSLWNSSTVGAGTRLWPASAPTAFPISVRQGVFSANIGDTGAGYPDALDYNFNQASNVYLQIEVSSDNSSFQTLSPRQRVSSAPFAQVSGAVSGTGQSAFGTTTPFDGATVSVEATSTNSVALSLRAILGQLANIFQIKDSTGANLFSIDATGGTTINSTLAVSGLAGFGRASSTLFSSLDGIAVGRTATTSIVGETQATSTFAGAVDITRGLNVTSYLYGSGLTTCTGSTAKLIWSNGRFDCGVDAGAGGGITALLAQYSSPQTGSAQTLATSSDTNIGLTITSSGDTHTFTPSWIGTLAVARGGTGSTTLSGLLKGNGTSQVATAVAGTDYVVPTVTTLASLSLPASQLTNFGTPFYSFFSATTTDALTEGATNKYFTAGTFNTSFDARLGASTSLPQLTSAANLATVGTLTNLTVTNPITGSISGNAGTVTNGVYTTTFNTLADTRFTTNLAATSSVSSITTLPNLSLPASQLASFGSPFYTFFSATNTTALAEGNNLYFTSARATTSFIANLAATTSVASITTLPNLTSAANLAAIGTLTNLTVTNPITGSITGSAGSATGNAGTVTNGVYTTTLGGLFYNYFSATNTDALAQGSTNRYYSDTLVNSYINGSSTIPKAYTANIFTRLQEFNGNASTTQLTVDDNFYGAGLADCVGSDDKLIWSGGRFDCGADAGAGGGITALGAQYSSFQSGSSQTFATSSDTNIKLTVTSSGDTHTFTPAWSGTLAVGRGGTGLSSVSANQLLVGNAAGTGVTQIATSSLGLLTTDVNEGSNLYFTNTRFDARFITDLAATSSVASITTLPNLSLPASQLTNFGTPFYSFFSATTTDALTEGATNKYFTAGTFNTSFDARLGASTSLPQLTSAANLATVGTITSGTWQGTAIGDAYLTKTGAWTGTFDGQEGTYYSNANNLTNFGTPFYSYFSATTTDALTQGSTNKYYTDAQVQAFIHASTTIPKTYTTNTFTGANAFNSTVTIGSLGGLLFGTSGVVSAVATSSLNVALSDTTGTLAVNRGGTGLTAYTIGDVLYASGATTLAGTSTANLKTTLGLANVENTALSTWAGSTNLTTLGTISAGTWQGTVIADAYLTKTGAWTGTFDGQEGSYYLDARNQTNFGLPFYTFFNATTTTALAEGNNLYYTANRVAGVIAGTTTDALAVGTTNKYFTNTLADARFVTNLAATSSVASITTLANLTTVGTLGDLTVTNPIVGSITGSAGSATGNAGTVTNGVYTTTFGGLFDNRFAATTTTALAEGSNLYFTNNRFDTRFIANLAATTSVASITTLPGLTSAATLATVGTIGTGVWQGTAIGDAYLTKTGAWTGTFDGQEGTYYLDRTNHTGTQLAATISDFSTTARGLISSSATGLTYTSGTGAFSLTSGYNIPLTASTTNWNAFYDTPSTRIAAGTGLSWSGNTLNASGGSSGSDFTFSTNFGQVMAATTSPLWAKGGLYASSTSDANTVVFKGDNFATTTIGDNNNYFTFSRFETGGPSVPMISANTSGVGPLGLLNGNWYLKQDVGAGFNPTLGFVDNTFGVNAMIAMDSTTGALTVTANLINLSGPVFATALTPTDIGDNYVCLSSGNELRTGAACTASSREVKDDIADLPNGLDMVNALRPVTFKFKPGYYGGAESLGFIAEEVNEVSPLLTVKNGEGKVYGVKYDIITSVLTSAVQELDFNLKTIASTTGYSTDRSQAFADSFFSNIFKRITIWFADSANGIGDAFANTFQAKEKICVDDQCLTKDDIKALLEMAHQNNQAAVGSTNSGGVSIPEPEPEQNSTSTPETNSPEETNTITDPVPTEDVSAETVDNSTPAPEVVPESEPVSVEDSPASEPTPSPEPALADQL